MRQLLIFNSLEKNQFFIDCMSLKNTKMEVIGLDINNFVNIFKSYTLTSKKKIPFNYLLRSNLEGLSSKDYQICFLF